MDKITVIVPVYNQAEFLDECILSILNQTYKNLEIILVDDGSTDNSLEICKRYQESDKRIKVIHKENGGLPSARNAGLDIAKGKYIMFCDSDDYYLPNSCELLLKEMTKRKADYVVGNYINCSEDGVLWDSPVFDQKEYKNFRLSINDYKKSFYVMSSSVCNKMFRRSFLKKLGMRFTEGVPAEDAIFTTYCFIKSKATYYIKDIMYVYRQRNGTSISTNNDLHYFKGISKAYRYIYNNFKDNDELGFYRYFYVKTLFYIMYKYIDSTVMTFEEKEQALDELKWFIKLSKKLQIIYGKDEFFEIIEFVISDNYKMAIAKCEELRIKRNKLNEEDKLKMTKIPPKECHKYILRSEIYDKKKNSFSSRYGKLGISYRGEDTTTEFREAI